MSRAIRSTNERLSRDELAALVAGQIPQGSYVNLGIGHPTRVSNFLTPEQDVMLQTENGLLGMGPIVSGAAVDYDLINAGKDPVSIVAGASYFHHADSFAMMRGRHLDICVMGAFEVSIRGDLANWATNDPHAIPSVGGAMDLAEGAGQVFVMMELFSKTGAPKLVPRLAYPATGYGCVTRVFTPSATFLLGEDDPLITSLHGIEAGQLEARLGLPLRLEATE